MGLICLVPKKFICRYPLKLGANIFATILTCVKIACIIIITTEMVNFSKCQSCTKGVLKSAYGYSGTAIIYCIIMICIHLLLIFAIRKDKASMVLIWVVVTSMWLAQTLCLTLVLLCLFMADASFVTWVLCFVFGIVAFGIAAYAILVAFGLWLEMRELTGSTT